MFRLLQGDVGSGKTIISLLAEGLDPKLSSSNLAPGKLISDVSVRMY